MTSKLAYEMVGHGHDLDKVCDVIVEALKDSSYSEHTPNRDKLKELIKQCNAYDSDGKKFLLVAVDEDKYVGIVGGILIEDHFLLSKMGQEVLWWVHPDYRKQTVAKELLECLESWCKYHNAKYLHMSHYENEYAPKMRKMYEKNGFVLKEYNYSKEII